MRDLLENPDVPNRYAKLFVKSMRAYGYDLDFTRRSLLNDFELIFQDERIAGEFDSKKHTRSVAFDFQTGMACYLAETLRKKFNGLWKGHCTLNCAANVYISYMMFGEYKFNPYMYIGYRVTHGVKETDTVEKLLANLTPFLASGVEQKNRDREEAISQGKLFDNTEPWL